MYDRAPKGVNIFYMLSCGLFLGLKHRFCLIFFLVKSKKKFSNILFGGAWRNHHPYLNGTIIVKNKLYAMVI